MAFYKEIEKIVPYLKSIRKLEKYLSFDIEFPSSWRIPKKYVIEGKVVEQDKTDPSKRLISFVAELTEEETNKTINNISLIVEYNKELEEKELLFQNKVDELKKIFEKQNLDKLQSLKFELKEYKLGNDDEEQRNADSVVTE